MPSRQIVTALAMLGAALSGCGAVKVRPQQDGLHLDPKPADCDLDLLFKAPQRPFERIAELDAHVTTPGGSPEVFRETACGLGADALIVIRDFVTNRLGHKILAVMAIKYDAPPEVPPGAAGRL
jgi:hypothetical protein